MRGAGSYFDLELQVRATPPLSSEHGAVRRPARDSRGDAANLNACQADASHGPTPVPPDGTDDDPDDSVRCAGAQVEWAADLHIQVGWNGIPLIVVEGLYLSAGIKACMKMLEMTPDEAPNFFPNLDGMRLCLQRRPELDVQVCAAERARGWRSRAFRHKAEIDT
eukprot:29352-Rhodomonas_salina.2